MSHPYWFAAAVTALAVIAFLAGVLAGWKLKRPS